MRTIHSALAVVLLAAAAHSQTAEPKVFRFVNTDRPQGFQEIVNAIRSIAELQQVSLVTDSKALAVRGTEAQLSMAEWLFRALDRPAGVSSASKLEYAIPGASNDLARVFYIANAGNPQNLQEIVNSIRSIGEVQRVSVCNQPFALAIRGTAAQMVMAEWLIRALDLAPGTGPHATESLTLTGPEFGTQGNPNVAKVLYPSFLTTPRHVQESVNMIRTVAELQRVVAYNGAGAIILRGTGEQVTLAEWLLNSLTTPSKAEGPAIRQTPPAEMVTRMFHVANVSFPQAFQELVSQLHDWIGLQRVATYASERAIALRGTAQQMAAAEKLIHDADRPIAQ